MGTLFIDKTGGDIPHTGYYHSTVGIVSVVTGISIAYDGADEKNTMLFKRSAVTLAISVLGIVIIPTKQDMFLIYGVGTTLDYLQDNEKVQQLPDKCVDALDAWVESLSEEKK